MRCGTIATMTWKWQYDGTPNSAVNLTPATGGWTMYYFKEFLKQINWQIISSGDGTSYFAASDGITTGNSGAGGMANNSAWFRAYHATTGYEMVFQRGTANRDWRFKWSHSARFTGGAPSATVPPTATDQQHLAGTDGPTYLTSWLFTDGAYRLHMGGDDADGTFWFCAPTTAALAQSRGIVLLPLLSGTYPVEDTAPYVVGLASSTPYTIANLGSLVLNTGLANGYYKKGLGGELWLPYKIAPIGANSTALYNNIAVNAYTTGDNIFPPLVFRVSGDGSSGVKGFIPTTHIYVDLQTRADNDVVNVGAVSYFINNDVGFRWPSGVGPT